MALPNKGVVVREFSPKDVRDIYEIRALPESAVAKDAASHLPRAELEAIIAIYKAKKLNAKKDFAFDLVKDVGKAARIAWLLVRTMVTPTPLAISTLSRSSRIEPTSLLR
jgi:DNA-binding GntR family transcriptional regulator